MEYMIGSAGTANALSKYINSLTGNKIQDVLKSTLSMNVPTLASYPDLLALGLVLVVIGTSILSNVWFRFFYFLFNFNE